MGVSGNEAVNGTKVVQYVNDKIRMYKKWNLTMYKIVHN